MEVGHFLTFGEREMFEELDELKAHLDGLRPLDPDRLAAVKEKLRIDWTYNSNAIEGNTFTLQETVFVLREGLTVKGKPLSEYLEVIGHAEAIDWLEEVVREKRPLTERLIKDLHAIVMRGSTSITIGPPGNMVTKRVEPGCYKYDNNHVIKPDGSIHYYVDHLQVPGEMEALIRWYDENREAMHPVELAARLHHRLVAIHPFTDGNGRVSRLVMNMALMQAGYFPAIIKTEDRREYLDALDSADAGEYGPFVAMVEREAYRTMKLVVDVVEGREAFGKEDLRRMVAGFAERVGKLDKDIGLISKEVDTKSQWIFALKLSAFIEVLAKDIVSNIKSDELGFIVNTGSFSGTGEEGQIIKIELQKSRKYIPRSTCYIRIVPKGANCELRSSYDMYLLDSDEEMITDVDKPITSIRVYIGSGDFDGKVVESFFAESIKGFLKAIDTEIESRRRTISEQNNG